MTRTSEPPSEVAATCRSIASWVDEGVFAISDRDDPRWAQVLVGIRNLYDLDDDWDGMDAAKPSHAICDVALRLALACRDHPAPIPSHVAATPAGTILFSWQSLDDYREIEVVGPDHLEWMTVDATDTATHGEWKIEEIPDERTADGALPLHSGNDRGRKADRGRLT